MIIARPKKTMMMLFGQVGKCSVLLNPQQRWTVVDMTDDMAYVSRNNISLKLPRKDFVEHWRICDDD